MTVCSRCCSTITGRVIHDEGVPWCEPCRQDDIRHRAALKAGRVLRRGVDVARALVAIAALCTCKRWKRAAA